MAASSAFDNEAIKEDYLTALAKDVRNAGLGISILNDLMTDGSFPAAEYDKDAGGDPHHHYRKYIHQDVTCNLAMGVLTIYISHLNLSGSSISESSYPWTLTGSATPTADGGGKSNDGVKPEGAPSPGSDTSTEPIPLTKKLGPLETTLLQIAEHGGDSSSRFPKLGKTSADTPSRAALTDFKATYVNAGDDNARIWDAAMQRIKLAVTHVMTHKVYGLRTIASKDSVRDDFGFTKFEVDATDCAFTRLDRLFGFFPSLEVMINSLEHINTAASYGNSPFMYVNMAKLQEVLRLLNTAYALDGGTSATRLERKDLVTLAYYRSTIDYVHNEKRYPKELLTVAKESYGKLINILVLEPQMARSDVADNMRISMDGVTADREAGYRGLPLRVHQRCLQHQPGDHEDTGVRPRRGADRRAGISPVDAAVRSDRGDAGPEHPTSARLRRDVLPALEDGEPLTRPPTGALGWHLPAPPALSTARYGYIRDHQHGAQTATGRPDHGRERQGCPRGLRKGPPRRTRRGGLRRVERRTRSRGELRGACRLATPVRGRTFPVAAR